MKYWITYYQFNGSGVEGDEHIIIQEHPLIWEKNLKQDKFDPFRPVLKDWKEIPDEVADQISRGW